jgi:hypothetical protein
VCVLCSQDLFGIPMLAGLVWHPYASFHTCLASLCRWSASLCSLPYLFVIPMLAGLVGHPYARFHTCLASLCSQDLFGIPMLAGLVWHPYVAGRHPYARLVWHTYARRTCLASLCSLPYLFGIPMLAGLVWHPYARRTCLVMTRAKKATVNRANLAGGWLRHWTPSPSSDSLFSSQRGPSYDITLVITTPYSYLMCVTWSVCVCMCMCACFRCVCV